MEHNTTILYFSATGNSLYVAKSLGGELCSIPQMIKQGRYEFKNQKIGIVFPIYSWAVNTLVLDFIKKAKFDCEYLFAVGTFGIFAGGFASHLQQAAGERGICFDYINKIKMVDNYVLGFKMDSQIKNEPKKQIEKQLEQVKSDVAQAKKWIVPEGVFVKKATTMMVKSTIQKAEQPNENRGIKKNLRVTDDCVGCGVCTKVCPVGNIALDATTGKIKLQDKCFMCFGCLQNCPQKAIHVKMEMDGSRFRNKNVTLQEIIQANQQV